MISNSISITAPAKINLVLEILGVDKDGYHNLSTVFQALKLADQLTMTRAETTSLTLLDNVNTGLKIETDANNLVIKAKLALEAYCQRELPCSMHLVKAIPAGGGLFSGPPGGRCAPAILPPFPDGVPAGGPHHTLPGGGDGAADAAPPGRGRGAGLGKLGG